MTERIPIMAVIGTAIAAVIGLIFAVSGLLPVGAPDTDAFWNAAERLRNEQQLYAPSTPDADDAYKYAPWFAWAWVPLSLLPKEAVYSAWTLTLVAGAFATALPLFRLGWSGIALGCLTLGVLLHAAGYGNPTPLMTAALSASRAHPIVVGIAGSLKVYPLLLSAGAAAGRRWREVALAWLTAALLWLPAAWYGFDSYVLDPGSGGVGLWAWWPPAWAVVAVIAACATGWLVIQRSHWAWVAAAAMIALAVPRVWPGELAYFVVAAQVVRARHPSTGRLPTNDVG